MVFPAKYRRKVFVETVTESLKLVCLGISERYEIHFVEIGTDEDHIHFLVQGVPSMSVSEITRIIKSITAKEIFSRHPEVKKLLWGGKFWTSGYYVCRQSNLNFSLRSVFINSKLIHFSDISI